MAVNFSEVTANHVRVKELQLCHKINVMCNIYFFVTNNFP